MNSEINSNQISAEEIHSQAKESRTRQVFENSWERFRTALESHLQEKAWDQIGFNAAMVFFLIMIGMFIRILLAYQFRVNWGYQNAEPVWNWNLPFNISGTYIEGFADFGYYYHSWITSWYEQNWYPYEWAEPFDEQDFYSYPPVFLYFLILTWRPGMTNFWMAFPMILADASCAGAVYLILKDIIKNEKARGIAFFGGFLMALAPINVVYDGIWWLNPGPVTILTLVAFYFAIKKKWWQAFFWLAVATMTKQNALFFSYPMFMVMLGEKVRNRSILEAIIESVMNALLFLGVALFLSIPWIFISPVQYGRHMLFPGKPIELSTVIVDPPSNQCVSFSRSLLEVGIGGIISSIVAFGINSMLLMVLSATLIAIPMLWRSFKGKLDGIEFFEWIAIYTIVTHIFMPRGVYKFYTAYYVPMILIALIGSFTYMSTNKKYLPIGLILASFLFLGFNIWLITINRLLVPFYLFMVALSIGFIAILRTFFRPEAIQGNNYLRLIQFFDSKVGK